MVDTTRLSGIIKASGKKTGQNSSTANAKMAEGKVAQKNVNTTNLAGISKATGTASQTGKKVAAVAKEQNQPKKVNPKIVNPIPLSTFGTQTKPTAKPVNTTTIEGIRDASKTGSSGIKSSGKSGQSSTKNNLRMAESKPVKKYGDENRSSLQPVAPKIITGGGKKGSGKTGGSYTSGGSTTPTTKPITSTTKPEVKPITTTATPAPKPTPSVPAKTTSSGVSTTASGSSSSTGTPIKIATSNLFVLNEPEQEIEQMANLIIQDIGGIELLSYSRNDLIAEQEINYQPIKNIADTSLQYNPLNILAIQDIDLDYFNKFPISLERHLPRFGNGTNGEYVYINSNNEIVVEAVNLLPGEYIEIQFLSFGSTVSDTIYT